MAQFFCRVGARSPRFSDQSSVINWGIGEVGDKEDKEIWGVWETFH